MLSATAPANAPVGVTVIVLVPAAPGASVNDAGDADSEKSSPPHVPPYRSARYDAAGAGSGSSALAP